MLDPEDFMDQNVLYWVGLRHAKFHDRVKIKPGYKTRGENKIFIVSPAKFSET